MDSATSSTARGRDHPRPLRPGRLGNAGEYRRLDATRRRDYHPDLDEAMLEDDNLFVPKSFEAAAPPSTSGQLTEAWLHRQIQKFYGASAFIIENKARDIL